MSLVDSKEKEGECRLVASPAWWCRRVRHRATRDRKVSARGSVANNVQTKVEVSPLRFLEGFTNHSQAEIADLANFFFAGHTWLDA